MAEEFLSNYFEVALVSLRPLRILKRPLRNANRTQRFSQTRNSRQRDALPRTERLIQRIRAARQDRRRQKEIHQGYCNFGRQVDGPQKGVVPELKVPRDKDALFLQTVLAHS